MFDPDYEITRSRATEPLFYRAPFPPQRPPREFQQAAVEYALSRDHCLIGDEPGVGKTYTAILISNALQAKRTLVICPASLRLNWEREINLGSTIAGHYRPARGRDGRVQKVWSPGPYVSVATKASHGINIDASYVVISYDIMRNEDIVRAIMAAPDGWDHVILDEAHAIKSPDAKRMRAICAEDGIKKVAKRFTLLSGTILPNQPIECYNAVRLLDWSAIDYMSEDAFRSEYYAMGGGMVRGKVWDDKIKANVVKVHWSEKVRNVPTNLEDLQRRLRSKIMIRRLKEHVHTQLPAKQIHLVPLEMTPDLRAAMKHPGWGEVSKLYDIDPEGFNAHMPIDGAISTARRALGDAKAPLACAYIEELLAEGIKKLVVSAWHTSVLAVLRAKLAKAGLVYMDGATSGKARQAAVDAFQTDPAVRVFLGQTQVAGEGITLTAAQDVVLVEPDYVPGRIHQMIDRIHRMGQTGGHVTAHLLVAPGTLDERIVATAVDKDRSIFLALDAC